MSRFLDILCWTHVGHQGRTNGHAAILMDGSVESADPAANAAAKTYISWWPAGAALKGRTTAISMRPGGERTLLSDMRNEISNSSQLGLHVGRDGQRFAPRPGQVMVSAEPLDVGSGPLNVLDHASAEEHQQFMNVLASDEADGGGLHKQWVQFPTEIIGLHVEGNGELGLNAHAMLTWWRGFRTAHQQALHGESGYRFVSKLHNCASIVMRALIAGEAAFFLKPPAPWVTFSPRDVADYAAALKTEIIRANADYDRYFNSKLEWQGQNRREMHMHPPTATTEMPTVEQWKRMSDANVTFAALSRRREQNAAIDRLLGQYHAQLPWDGGGADYRLEYMKLIFQQIGSYIAAKPKGDRLNAMLALGQIVLAVREAKAAAIDIGFFD
jgi:hypothetical protein